MLGVLHAELGSAQRADRADGVLPLGGWSDSSETMS